MKFQVTAQHLAHIFPASEMNYERMIQQLNLDLGHLQLLRDAYQAWGDELQQHKSFWQLLLALVDAVNNGSLCLDLTHDAVAEKLQKLPIKKVSELTQDIEFNSLKIKGKNILEFSEGCLYFSKYFQLENSLQNALAQLLNKHSGTEFTAEQVAKATLQVTADLDFPSIENKQILAVVMSLLKPFSIISGGPGTGKTTIMSSVLRGLMVLGFQPADVALAAPTGRAANRMTESLQDVIGNHIKNPNQHDEALMSLEAQTIHRLLGARAERRGFRYGAHNHLNCKILVVDEVSMVDVSLMSRLLSAVPNDCRVILLGDQFQLPSVDVGAVLADLMPPVGMADSYSETMLKQLTIALDSFKQGADILQSLNQHNNPSMLTDHVTVLAVSKRSQAEIAQFAEQVRLGHSDVIVNQQTWVPAEIAIESLDTQEFGVQMIQAADSYKPWQHFYCQWVNSHYFKTENKFIHHIHALREYNADQLTTYSTELDVIFQVINSNRILTLVNDSAVGALQINTQITELMKQSLASSGVDNRFHGSVIMLRKNNAALGLFNGDVAVLLAANNGQLRAVLPQKGGYQSHSIHVLPEFSSAYAITVHKSQGSEYAHVLLALPEDEQHRLLCREIIYTGITRAKDSVQIYSQAQVLKTAIEKQTIRHSGLRLWYNDNNT